MKYYLIAGCAYLAFHGFLLTCSAEDPIPGQPPSNCAGWVNVLESWRGTIAELCSMSEGCVVDEGRRCDGTQIGLDENYGTYLVRDCSADHGSYVPYVRWKAVKCVPKGKTTTKKPDRSKPSPTPWSRIDNPWGPLDPKWGAALAHIRTFHSRGDWIDPDGNPSDGSLLGDSLEEWYPPAEDPTFSDSLLLYRVIPGGPCAERGLREGDQIVEVDGSEIQKAYLVSDICDEQKSLELKLKDGRVIRRKE